MLTADDINRIAEAVHAKHAASDFHITPKEHYDAHQRLGRLLDVYDRCESAAWKLVVGAFIVAGVLVSAVWFALHK